MDNKEIEKLWNDSVNEDFVNAHSLNKYTFKSLVSGLQTKLIGREEAEAKKQLSILNRMDSFLDRLTYVNCISIFQAKIIKSQEHRIAILEQQNHDLIERSTKKIEALEKELMNVKKRIKNDKESS